MIHNNQHVHFMIRECQPENTEVFWTLELQQHIPTTIETHICVICALDLTMHHCVIRHTHTNVHKSVHTHTHTPPHAQTHGHKTHIRPLAKDWRPPPCWELHFYMVCFFPV